MPFYAKQRTKDVLALVEIDINGKCWGTREIVLNGRMCWHWELNFNEMVNN